ncbi:MAG: hypothetical protein RMM08_05365 [Armatimonadota bacterium]|nr:hypothetical protein [bacterium]MDW8320770.1 hypothetical protein [Armatimonadota bacterium]
MAGLIVVATPSRLPAGQVFRRMLLHFGISCDVMVASEVQRAGGKNFINARYGFAVWLEYRYANRTDTTGNEVYTWLEYSPGDKPIFYIGGQVRGRVPNDFPILAFNPADSSTYYQTERAQYSTEDMRLVGSCVRLADNSAYLWGRFVNYTWPSSSAQYEYGYYRVDMSKLDNTREVMWRLDHARMGIPAPPENHAVVVRYHNRYFLPQSGYDVMPFPHENMFSTGRRLAGIGLFLWCLAHAGIKPRRRVTTWWEIDHPLNSGGYRHYTAQQRLYLLRLSTEWLYDFTRFRNIHITCGITTNHTRDSTWGHYKTLITFPQEAQPIHDLLVHAEREGRWAMCWHDHSYELGASGAMYTRHTGGRYGAPVTISSPDCNFGTSQVGRVNLYSEMPLLVHLEDQERWMQQFGFASAWGGAHRHINFANNSSGGVEVVTLLNRLRRLRSCRIIPDREYCSPWPSGSYPNPGWRMPTDVLQVGGVELISCEDLHLVAQRGLYNPGSGGKDVDLNQQYGLGATSPQQAYRRFMAMQMDRFLTLAVYNIGCVYLHDTACTAASLSTPLARFLENGNWNGYVELFSETDNVLQVLADWIYWGTPSQMQEYRRWLRANLDAVPVDWVMRHFIARRHSA